MTYIRKLTDRNGISKLTDRHGNRVATIHGRPDGRIEIKDKNGHSEGTYDPKSDRTYDQNGIFVGGGNWLAALLLREFVRS